VNRRHLLFFVAVVAVPFILYDMINPYIIGMDGYYYLNAVCRNGELVGETPLTISIFSLIPCHMGVIKAIMYLLALASTLAVAKTGEVFHKNGWLAGLFVFLSPLIIFEFAKLENENFAFPLLFFANHLILDGMKKKCVKRQLVAIALVILAGQIWQGSIYYILIYGIMTAVASPFTMAAILRFGNTLTDRLIPVTPVWENTFGVGLIFLGAFTFTIIGVFLEPFIIIPSIWWFAIMIYNPKFGIHVIPFLAVGAVNLYNSKQLNKLDVKYKKPIWGTVKTALVITSVIMLFVGGFAIATAQPPTRGHVRLVKEFIAFQDAGFEAKNGWSYGYWVRYFGGTPTAWSGGEWNQDFSTGYILTHLDLNCPLVDESAEMQLYACSVQ